MDLYHEWHLASADVRLNRRLRGSCVQCLEGKMHDKNMVVLSMLMLHSAISFYVLTFMSFVCDTMR